MSYVWSILFILQYFLSICHAELGAIVPVERMGRFHKASSTAPVKPQPPIYASHNTVPSYLLGTRSASGSTIHNNYSGISTGFIVTSRTIVSNLPSITPSTAVNIPSGGATAVNSSGLAIDSPTITVSKGTTTGNLSSSNPGASSVARISSILANNQTNVSITLAPGSKTSSSAITSGILPFLSSTHANSTVSSGTSSNSANNSTLSISSIIAPSLSATNSSIAPSSVVLNSSIAPFSVVVNSSIAPSSVVVNSSIAPSLVVINSSTVTSSIITSINGIVSSIATNSSVTPSLFAANSSTIPALSATISSGAPPSTATNSSSIAPAALTSTSANRSTTASIFIPPTTVSSSIANLTGGISISEGSSTTSSTTSLPSSSVEGGASPGGGPGGVVPVVGGGAGGLGGGLGGPGGGLGGGSGGSDGGDGGNENKPSISNPSLSNSQPSQTPTSPTQNPTSSSQSLPSSISSTISTTQTSSSIAPSSATSSFITSTSITSTLTTSTAMNLTSVSSSSTAINPTNSSLTSTSSAIGAYCSVGACNGPQCDATSIPASKRDRPLIDGRLPTPQDFLRRDLLERNESSASEQHENNDLWKRGYIPLLTDPDFANNINNFITEQITYPGAKPCPLPSLNPDSTAIIVKFDSPPDDGNYFPSLQGLEGCTSVVIIGENGCWISHFWEVPWFFGFSSHPDAFTANVITPLENGNGPNMPSPFAAGGQVNRIPELAAGQDNFQPEIHIFTRMDNGAITYPEQVALIQQALTGPGRAFAGIPVTTTGYVRQEPDSRIAKGKILVQYTNDQEDDEGNQLVCPQEAIYKLWFEENMISQHTWPAIGDQLAVPNAKAKLRRSQQCPSNATASSLPSTPSSPPIASLASTAIYNSIGSGGSPIPKAPVASLVSATLYPSFTTQIRSVSTPAGIALVSSGSLVYGPYPVSIVANSPSWNTVIFAPTDVPQRNPTVLDMKPDQLY